MTARLCANVGMFRLIQIQIPLRTQADVTLQQALVRAQLHLPGWLTK